LSLVTEIQKLYIIGGPQDPLGGLKTARSVLKKWSGGMLPALGKTGPFSPPWGGPRGGPPGPWRGVPGPPGPPPPTPPGGVGGTPLSGIEGPPIAHFMGFADVGVMPKTIVRPKLYVHGLRVLRLVPRDSVKERSMHSFLTETSDISPHFLSFFFSS